MTDSSTTPEKGALITLQGVCFERGKRQIFDGIDMQVQRGKITAILGPSGTGKTTLLRLIGGQLTPSAGSVTVDGHDLAALDRDGLFTLRKRMGMLFQSGALLGDLDVFENVAYPLREHTALSEAMIRTVVLMKLELVGLRAAHHLYPRELSGGMARRVALARAVVLDPMVVMYDEPFAGQDPISMGVVVKLIRELSTALGLTSVLVSHDVPETTSIADYIYVLAGGKVAGHGPPAVLKASGVGMVNQFLNGEPDGPVPFHYPGPSLAEDLLG